MKIINTIIISGFTLLIGIVLIKSFGYGHFRNDAEKWAGPSIDHSNVITQERLQFMHGNILLVNINEEGENPVAKQGSIAIPASRILDKQNVRKLHDYEGDIILISDDEALSARIWMLLSQMGIKDLYLLASK